MIVPWVSWSGELTGKVDYHPKTTWFPEPPTEGQICFTVFFSAAEKTSDSLTEILHAECMYGTEPLVLQNGEQVWLCAEMKERLAEHETSYVESISSEFLGFSTEGSADQMKAYAQDIHKDRPLIIEFPLGRKHFGLG